MSRKAKPPTVSPNAKLSELLSFHDSLESFRSTYPDKLFRINGHVCKKVPGAVYKHDYEKICFTLEKTGYWEGKNQIETYRELIGNDLFFILYFVQGVPVANHPFVLKCCREVEDLEERRQTDGTLKNILWVWAREHFKTTLLSTALSIQRILKNPEKTIGIFSHNRPAAKAILREIKQTFQNSLLLQTCYSDVLWANPEKEAPKWSEDDGIILKRRTNRKESSVEAWGLIDGSPTGKHFDFRLYDDISTIELVDSPDIIQKLKDRFDMSVNLGTNEGFSDVIGTFYHHQDVLVHAKNKKNVDGELLYHFDIRTATDDGTPNGQPVFLSPRRIKELQANKQHFYSQQLCDPTPRGTQRLNADLLVRVPNDKIPKRLYKFMIVDPAGERKSDKRDGDSWAMAVFGVEPFLSDVSMSRVYMLDLIADPMTLNEAMKSIVEMYIRHGRILRLGIEKVGMSMLEIHVQQAMRARGRNVTVESGLMQILRPEGRAKEARISGALEIPLYNGMMHVTPGVRPGYLDKLIVEMNKFPYAHDDILDVWSYLYDILRDYSFGRVAPSEDGWSKRQSKRSGWATGSSGAWMIQ